MKSSEKEKAPKTRRNWVWSYKAISTEYKPQPERKEFLVKEVKLPK